MEVLRRLHRKKTLFNLLRKIGELGYQQGYPVYAVGGIVRDLILGRPIKDIDISVIGNGIDFAYLLAAMLKSKKVVTFDRFGTAMVPYRRYQIEIVTARSETYDSHSRKPYVKPSDLRDDLARRDFTINTLAFSLLPDTFGELIDIFGGLKDIENKIVRTPLEPGVTFSDDPLRMLRAIRFATVLQFSIDPITFAAIRARRERLKIVSQERITEELLKILAADKPSLGFLLMEDCGLLELILPEIHAMVGLEQRQPHHHKNIFHHTLQVLDNTAEMTNKLELRFAALVHDIAKPKTRSYREGVGWTFYGHEYIGAEMIEQLGRRLKLPMKMVKYAQKLTRLHLRPIALVSEEVTDSAVRRLMVDAGEELEDLMLLCRADITSRNPEKVQQYRRNFDLVVQKMKEVKEKDALRAFQSPVKGDVIMQQCNLSPGPIVGFIKKQIEEAILNGEIPNEFEPAFQFFLKNKEQWIREFQDLTRNKKN